MDRRHDLRRRDARSGIVSADAERHTPARQVARRSPIDHRLFVPSPQRKHTGLAPLVVALHGCTQTASDFAAGTRFDSVAERAGAYVVYPEQATSANSNRCWNWFLEANQYRESGEPAEIILLVTDLVTRYPIDTGRVFVAGLSAGGAMAAILGEQAPDVFAAVGIMAGVPLHASSDLTTALSAMHGDVSRAHLAPHPSGYERLRVSVWSGRRDRVVVPANASTLASQFIQLLALKERVSERDRREEMEILRYSDASGRVRVEEWRVDALGHAWSGGSFRGSHTHPSGPRASDQMMAFFMDDEEIVPRAEDAALA